MENNRLADSTLVSGWDLQIIRGIEKEECGE